MGTFSVSRWELLWWFCLICHLFIWGSHDEDYRDWTNPPCETDYYWDYLCVVACMLFHDVWFVQHWTFILSCEGFNRKKNILTLKVNNITTQILNITFSLEVNSYSICLCLRRSTRSQKSRLWTLLCHSEFSKQWWQLQIQSIMLFYILC